MTATEFEITPVEIDLETCTECNAGVPCAKCEKHLCISVDEDHWVYNDEIIERLTHPTKFEVLFQHYDCDVLE